MDFLRKDSHKDTKVQRKRIFVDVRLKSFSLCNRGRLRAGKTLGESAYEPPAVSLRRGTRRKCFSNTQPAPTAQTNIKHIASSRQSLSLQSLVRVVRGKKSQKKSILSQAKPQIQPIYICKKNFQEKKMLTKNQNPAQYEREPFPFGDGISVLDIRYDQVFKAVFTRDTPKSKGALSDLISALIGRTVAVETIIANEPPVDDLRQRYVRFDVACKTEEDELVNVEMSFNPDKNESARLEYYTARLFTGQDIHGKDKKYKDLKEAYQITIMAKDKFFPDEYLTHNFLYYDPDTRVSLNGKTRIITVELVKTKPIADKPVKEMTNTEAWAVFFQYLTDEDKRAKIIEIINNEEGIAMAAETLGNFTQSEVEYIRQLYQLKRELDYQNDTAWEREEAREEGHAKGLEEGRTEGREEGVLMTARNALVKGISIETIKEITGLNLDTIEKLQRY
jgi:predicted transposase/invertase (TIGR01784 family)